MTKPLLYADRQVIQILQTQSFERLPNGRWSFANGRSIADSVAQRLIAHGAAKKIGDQLVPKPLREKRDGQRVEQLSDCQRPEGER